MSATMSPLIAALLVASPPAAIAYAITRRYPHRDPLVPRLPIKVIDEKVRKHPRLARHLRSRLDPTSETGLLLTFAVGGAVLSLSSVGLLLRMIHSGSGIALYDLGFSRWGANNATAFSTHGLKLVSMLGGYEALTALSIGVAVLEYRRGLGRSVLPLLVLVVGGQFALVETVKAIVHRARPDLARLTGFSGASFPSGHAAAAAASFAAFSLLLGRRRSPTTKAIFAAVAAAITATVAASRVLLGVHWFTDVLGGVAIGWIWFTIVSLAFAGRVLRFGAPVIEAHAEAEVEVKAEVVKAEVNAEVNIETTAEEKVLTYRHTP